MSPDAPACGSVCPSAARLNAEIRALWQRAGGRLTAGERVEYQRLVVAWAAAVHAERQAEAAWHTNAPPQGGALVSPPLARRGGQSAVQRTTAVGSPPQ